MSEKAPKTSADSTPEKKGVDVFGVKNFDETREKQRQLIIDALDDVDRYDKDAVKKAKDRVYATFDDRARRQLIAEGAVTGEKDPTLEKKVEYIRHYSIDNMSEDDWLYDEVEDGAVKKRSGRNTVKEDFARLKAEAEIDEDEPEPLTDEKKDEDVTGTEEKKDETEEADKKEKDEDKEEKKDKDERAEKLAELEKQIETLRSAKHASYAKRMAVPVFRFRKKKAAQAEFEESEHEYLKKVAELEQLKMEIDTEEHSESYSRDEDVNALLAERFSARLKEDNDLQHEAMLKEGGFKARLLEKWANMSKKKKIALLVGGAAATAALGAGVAFIGGIIGAVGGTIAAGGWSAAKAQKSKWMTLSRMYKKKDVDALKVSFSSEKIEPSQALKEAIARLRGETKKDIDSGDKLKRRAVAVAMASAALGSMAGLGLSHGLDVVTNRTPGWTGGMTGDMIAGPEAAPSTLPDAQHMWTLPHGIEDTAPATPELNPTDLNIRPGEGGYELLQKAGVPKEHIHELWKSVGPELQNTKVDGQNFGYVMHGQFEGQTGIHMTSDHKVPDAVLKIINEKNNELFGSGAGSVAHEAASQATVPVDVDHVNLTTTDMNDLNGVIHMDTITPADIDAHQALADKLGYVANGASADALKSRIGIPDQVWLESLKPYMIDQIHDGNANYSNYFTVQGDNVLFATNQKLPSRTVADILNHIPRNVRENVTIS